MEGPAERDVSGALLECPLDGLIVDDPKRIEVVLGEEILRVVELLRLFESTEQVVRLADGDNGVTRTRRGDAACLLDLLPGYGGRLNSGTTTIQTGE